MERSRSASVWRLAVAAAVIAGSAFSLLGFAGSWHWYLDLFSHFRVQLCGMLALSLPVLLLQRRWWVAAVALIGIGANGVALLPHAVAPLPRSAAGAEDMVLRCASLNLLQGNEEHRRAAEFVRSSGASVVVFQEVSRDWEQPLRELADIYPTQLIRAQNDSKGAALLSRLPARSLRFELLPGQKQIGAVVAEFAAPTGNVTVFGIHSHKPTSREGFHSQHRYFQWLAQRAHEERRRGMQVVIMGDWNAAPWSEALQTFQRESGLMNASAGNLFSATWNRWLPHRLMIDHGFLSPDLALVTRKIGPFVGSDHRPLILEVTPRE